MYIVYTCSWCCSVYLFPLPLSPTPPSLPPLPPPPFLPLPPPLLSPPSPSLPLPPPRFSHEEDNTFCQTTRLLLYHIQTRRVRARALGLGTDRPIETDPRPDTGVETRAGVGPESVPPGSHDLPESVPLSSCDWQLQSGPGLPGRGSVCCTASSAGTVWVSSTQTWGRGGR